MLLKILGIKLPCDPEILSKNTKYVLLKYIFIPIIIAALLTIANIRKQLKCRLTDY